MGLEVGGKGDTKEKKKEEEKIPHMYESICHQPLWCCCLKKGEKYPFCFSNFPKVQPDNSTG